MCYLKKQISVLSLIFFGVLFSAAMVSADSFSVDFADTSGYGIDSERIMVENIRLDNEVTNPFDPTHPTIVSSYLNVPFVFDLATLHLIPDLGTAVIVDDTTQCASLNVYLSDAVTGEAISGGTVTVGSSSATTDVDGLAQLTNLTSGTAQVEATATGYVQADRQATLTCSDEPVEIGMALSSSSGDNALSANEVRVILTWGENPRDLDSHLTGPSDTSDGTTSDTENRFHVYYSYKNADVASLDVDDVSSYGPETITIVSPYEEGDILRPGLYRYSVHHFSGDSDISNSNASVTLQIGTSSRTFSPPAGSPGDNALWTVFELYVDSDGAMTVYEVNTYTENQASYSVTSTRTGYGSVENGIDFSRLPEK